MALRIVRLRRAAALPPATRLPFPAALPLAAAVAAAAILACAAARFEPTPLDDAWAAARWPGATAADMDEGYRLYLLKCAGCHQLPRPQAVATERWEPVMERMAPRAKLDSRQATLVLRYLTTVSARLTSAGGDTIAGGPAHPL
ncbi:MAG: hypothetical protein ACE15D_07330 [Candidatus Eisenbacteria bacterium]